MKSYLCLLLALLCLVSCSKSEEKNEADIYKKHIEILYFYDDSNKPENKAIQSEVTKLLNDNFQKELDDKTIILKEIDLNSSEGKELASQYNVKNTSLYVNNWIGEKEMKKNMTLLAMKNAASNPDIFESEIKKLLNGYLTAEVDSVKIRNAKENKTGKMVGGFPSTPPNPDNNKE